jgi:hypothetical protein
LRGQVTPAIETGQGPTCLSVFHILAAETPADRVSRVTLQASGPFPPWLMLPILTNEAIAGDAGSNEIPLRATHHFLEHVELLAELAQAGLLQADRAMYRLAANHPPLIKENSDSESMVLAYVRQHGRISRKEVLEQCQVSARQATYLLRKLVTQGSLVEQGAGRRIVEALANQVYTMETENAPGQRIWACRKAAWAIEDLEVDIELIHRQMGRTGLVGIPNVGLVCRQMGRKGLEGIENVGLRLAKVVEGLLHELSAWCRGLRPAVPQRLQWFSVD